MKTTIVKKVKGLILKHSYKILRKAMIILSVLLVFWGTTSNSNALPVIDLLKDELISYTRIWFNEISSPTWSDSYSGQALGVVGHLVGARAEYAGWEYCSTSSYFGEYGFSGFVMADNYGSQNAPSWNPQLYANGLAEMLLDWRFRVEGEGGSIGLTALGTGGGTDIVLYDETSGLTIAETKDLHSSGVSSLLDSHIYNLTAYSWVQTPTDPWAMFVIDFKNIEGIVPEPSSITIFLLGLGIFGLSGLKRKIKK